ncbi:unannotated protein [freshwater metagenome]|uniref:Unannotated protein n=1 Tax=freshwater metagenome TaxID=449393 RepID=A0A6J6TXE5_9ZZZZ
MRCPSVVLASYRRPDSKTSAARSKVSGRPKAPSAFAISFPDGRVVSVPSKYRISNPVAQPARSDTPSPAAVTPPPRMSARAIDPKTIPAKTFQRGRDIIRATVVNAARPPITTLNGTAVAGSIVPANAKSKRAESD